MTTYAQFRDGMKRPGKTPPIVRKPKPAPSKVPPVSSKPPAKPPAKTPPAKPAPPPMSPFEAWYMTNPAYLAAHPQYEQQRREIQAQYGWIPVLDAHGKPVLDANGLPTFTEAQGPGSEFSVAHQLEKSLAGRSQQIGDDANSHGLLFSGAMAQGQQNAKADNQRQTFDAQRAWQGALGGVNSNEANLISGLYDDYVKNAPPGGPPKTSASNGAAGAGGAGGAGGAARQVVQPFGAGRSTSPWMKYRTPRAQPPAGYKPPVSTSGWNATASQYDPKIHYWGATR